MSAGITAGVALLLSGAYRPPAPWQAFMLGLVAYLPTLVQVRYQRYGFKAVSRFSLGVGIVLALWAALFGESWLSWGVVVNVLYLTIFAALYVGTSRWRAKRLDVPCRRCPEGSFPFCTWRQAELKAALRDHEARLATLPEPLVHFLRVVDGDLSTSQSSGARRVAFVGWSCETSDTSREMRALSGATVAADRDGGNPVPTASSGDAPRDR